MAQAIVEDGEPLVPGEEARKAVDIIPAIYESSQMGRTLRLKQVAWTVHIERLQNAASGLEVSQYLANLR